MGVVKSTHWPQFIERESRNMAGIKRSAVPVARFGARSTEPAVSITENGQLRFNKLAGDAIGKGRLAIADWDPKTRIMRVQNIPMDKTPKGWDEADFYAINEGKKGGGSYASMSGVWRLPEVGYEFKASGTQIMKTDGVDAAKHSITFHVPKGALQARPKVTRTRKPKVDAKAEPKAKAAAAGASDEIQLD